MEEPEFSDNFPQFLNVFREFLCYLFLCPLVPFCTRKSTTGSIMTLSLGGLGCLCILGGWRSCHPWSFMHPNTVEPKASHYIISHLWHGTLRTVGTRNNNNNKECIEGQANVIFNLFLTAVNKLLHHHRFNLMYSLLVALIVCIPLWHNTCY